MTCSSSPTRRTHDYRRILGLEEAASETEGATEAVSRKDLAVGLHSMLTRDTDMASRLGSAARPTSAARRAKSKKSRNKKKRR